MIKKLSQGENRIKFQKKCIIKAVLRTVKLNILREKFWALLAILLTLLK